MKDNNMLSKRNRRMRGRTTTMMMMMLLVRVLFSALQLRYGRRGVVGGFGAGYGTGIRLIVVVDARRMGQIDQSAAEQWGVVWMEMNRLLYSMAISCSQNDVIRSISTIRPHLPPALLLLFVFSMATQSSVRPSIPCPIEMRNFPVLHSQSDILLLLGAKYPSGWILFFNIITGRRLYANCKTRNYFQTQTAMVVMLQWGIEREGAEQIGCCRLKRKPEVVLFSSKNELSDLKVFPLLSLVNQSYSPVSLIDTQLQLTRVWPLNISVWSRWIMHPIGINAIRAHNKIPARILCVDTDRWREIIIPVMIPEYT